MVKLRMPFINAQPNIFALFFLFFLLLLLAGSAQPVKKLTVSPVQQTLAQTPPMGFDQYNTFHDHITASQLKQVADAMVTSGMRDAGYTYFNIDDSWAGYTRTPDGMITIDTSQFPDVDGVNGIEDLAQYVHARGLKFGIYTTDGPYTCVGNRLGSLGYEVTDAKTYAAWGVDFLKIDGCSSWNNDQDVIHTAELFHILSIADGRPLVISMHAPDQFQPGDLPALFRYAQMSREFRDIDDTFASVLSHAIAQGRLVSYAGPGHWNDPDMLEVGLGGMNTIEDQTHFSLWCILAAPLLAGNDLRAMSAATRTILTNREAIAIDQDAAGIQGQLMSLQGTQEAWGKPLANGDYAVLLLNAGNAPATITVNTQIFGLKPAPLYVVRDLWAHSTSLSTGFLSATLPPHGSVLLRITLPASAALPTPPSLSTLLSLIFLWFLSNKHILPMRSASAAERSDSPH
jgi:alpha-galactosidase